MEILHIGLLLKPQAYTINNMNLIKCLDHLLTGKKLKELDFDNYPTFPINRGLSQHWDTCLIANEMNINADIPNEAQFVFLDQLISKKKRKHSKWSKAEKISNDVKLLQSVYGYSTKKAKEALTLLTNNDLDEIKKAMPKEGGIVKRRVK